MEDAKQCVEMERKVRAYKERKEVHNKKHLELKPDLREITSYFIGYKNLNRLNQCTHWKSMTVRNKSGNF